MSFSNGIRPVSEVTVNGRKIGYGHGSYFIADIAANHDGDLGRAKDLIYLAAEAGADAAKFQHFQANTIVSDMALSLLGANFRIKKNGQRVFSKSTKMQAWI